MNYQFPVIKTLDDVLPAIEGRDSFKLREKDGYSVVCYDYVDEYSFPDLGEDEHAAILRECRGLIFYPDGKLASRRYHKFFNINERHETHLPRVPDRELFILEKLDGSMVSPFLLDGGLRWATKKGISTTSLQAEVFAASHFGIKIFSDRIIRNGWTPIFEWCSRSCKIVIDHPTDRLVLTGVRHNETGVYAPQEWVKAIADHFKFESVKSFGTTIEDRDEFLLTARRDQQGEGFVVRLDNGHMVKAKSDWYCDLHRIISSTSKERMIVEKIINNEFDDAVAAMPEDIAKQAKQYHKEFWKEIMWSVQHLSCEAAKYISKTDDRKALAEAIADHPLRHFIFLIASGATAREVILKKLEMWIISRDKFAELKELFFPKVEWNVSMWSDAA